MSKVVTIEEHKKKLTLRKRKQHLNKEVSIFMNLYRRGELDEVVIIAKSVEGIGLITGNLTVREAKELFSDFIKNPKEYLD